MILVDANLLLYASLASFPQHSSARAWLQDVLSDKTRVAMPWPSIVAYVRVATNRRFLERPLSIPDAWKQVSEWLDHPRTWTPTPGDAHVAILQDMLLLPALTSRMADDAHLSALAIEHGLTLCSHDSDFARFVPFGLRWIDPLSRRHAGV